MYSQVTATPLLGDCTAICRLPAFCRSPSSRISLFLPVTMNTHSLPISPRLMNLSANSGWSLR